MPTNQRKREDLRRSANAVGQTKLSFKKQKSSVLETEEVSFIKLFISELKQYPPEKLLPTLRCNRKNCLGLSSCFIPTTVVLRLKY